MKLWIDGDACPGPVKRVVFRASQRLGIQVVVVANQPMSLPRSTLVRFVHVRRGPDVADRRIVEDSEAGDVTITADIPLAADLVAKGVHAISPHGEEFTEENVGERLAVRDLMQQLRDDGMVGGGPASYSDADLRRFASALDRTLTRLQKSTGSSSTP